MAEEEAKAETENTERGVEAAFPKGVFAKARDQIRNRSDYFRQIYTNNMAVSFSSWDVTITFGEIVGEQDGKTVVEETTRVVMTREIAKVLTALLANHIAIFEQNFGEIKIPVGEPAADQEEKAEAPEESKPQ
jgi:uncharacterized protein DUF3467